MSTPSQQILDQVSQHVRQTALLISTEALLGWDERCLLPSAAGDYRAEQITLLAGMIHDRSTDPRLGDWLGELVTSPLTKDPESETAATIRQLKRQYDKKTKLPKTLVEELTRTAVRGQQAWEEARHKSDYKIFLPLLEKTIHLKQQQADALGFKECRYDALLDEYEPDALTSRVTQVLAGLRGELVPLVSAIRDSGKQIDTSVLHRRYPVDAQKEFGREAASRIGYSFERGRLDVTSHPFCSGMGPDDCRITTRYDERFFNGGFFGILHEAGHGIYEQGLRTEQYGLPLGETVSLGIHESQSRMWENFVGRSRAFWEYFFPQARHVFSEALHGIPLDTFYAAINDVRPSLIRVEADEATYNLHILIRFELEQALIHGELDATDLPAAWNAKYEQSLGIKPANDAEGVLQDIHWSAGLFGYFATYSLGNLYAAQFFQQADDELGGLHAQFAQGDFIPLRTWLNTHIHQHGQHYPAARLVEKVTGRPLSHAPLMKHLRDKLGPLYGL